MTTLLRLLVVPGLLVLALLASPAAMAQGPTFDPARTPKEAADPPPVPGEDMTVQPRGPVHEAFAQASDMAPRPGPIVTKKPPDPIPEVPPDQKPEGDNVQWIPGYWAWDTDRNDYLWISGLWRVPPPGRKWVPGAWNTVEGGYQWSPGFWASVDQDDLQYLPAPPASVDNGPSIPQPNDDSFYVPGCWMYQSSRYLWQPGYWQTYRPGMIWTPSCYSWTPAGYLFSPGYWDWPLANRGLLFAPVAFNRPLWLTPGWSYQPSYCVASNGLLSSLFIGPTGGGFYFGNYYGPAYRRLGFQPWFASTGGAYSPLFSWYRWQNRKDPAWLNGLYTTYRGRYNGALPRPPLTINQRNTIVNNTTINSLPIVQPLSQLRSGSARLTRLSAAQVNEQRNLAQRFQQFSVQRQSLERQSLRETRRSLPLSRMPHAAPALGYAALSTPGSHINPVHAVAPRTAESRIVTAHHATVPATPPPPRIVPAPQRIATPVHPAPPVAPIEHNVITHHNPASVVHHTPAPAIAHHAPSAPHFALPARHFAPPAHVAPPAHHAAPPSHGAGHRR